MLFNPVDGTVSHTVLQYSKCDCTSAEKTAFMVDGSFITLQNFLTKPSAEDAFAVIMSTCFLKLSLLSIMTPISLCSKVIARLCSP